MAVMIPAAPPSDVPPSERRVFEKLKTSTGTDKWTVLHSLALSSALTGQFGEIDFLVVIPGLGLVCIEVKGGGVAVRNGVWTTKNAQGEVATLKRSPFAQAKEGMWKLRQALENRFGAHSVEMKCPVGWMVVLPDVVCPPPSPEFVRAEAIDVEDMRADIALRLAQAPSLAAAALWPGKIAPSEPVCRRLVDFLRPSFERPECDATRTWDAERRLVELTAQQFDVIDGLFDNDRVLVHGAAGTGKTVLALEAARRHAASGRRVLLTCFNRRLGDWLADETRASGPGRVVAGNLHRILRDDILASQFASEIDADKPDFGSGFFAVGALAQVDLRRAYDVVAIDEAQDFDPGCLREVIAAWSDRSDCRIMVFGDFSRQALYDASARSIGDLKTTLGRFATYGLSINCRNTRRIVRTIDSVTGLTGARISERAPEGDPVVTTYFADKIELIGKVNERVADLRTAGFAAGDIVILGPRKLENSGLADLRRIGGFDFGPLDGRSPRAVGYSTIHAFKGLERKVVLIVDITCDDPEGSDALLYVGMSRAMLRLFLFVEAAARARLDARILQHLKDNLGEVSHAS